MTSPDPGSEPASASRPSPVPPGGPDESGGADLAPGLRATVVAQVSREDTAAALGSGDVEVLGTPRLLALAEAATVAAVAPAVTGSRTTVGTAMTLRHRLPSGVGARVAVDAELTEIDGRRLVFSFIARAMDRDGGVDADGGPGERGSVIGTGTIERMLVDRERFAASAAAADRGY